MQFTVVKKIFGILFASLLGWSIQIAHVHAVTISPNVNLSKALGNQYETSVAINPNNSNQIFVTARNEIGGLYASTSNDGGVTWTSRLMANRAIPAAGDVPRAYGNATVAWDGFGNLFLAYLSQATINTAATYVTLAVSTDGGASFHSPTGVGASIFLPTNSNMPVFGDQPTITVGAGSAGFVGSVWVTYFTKGGIAVSGAGVSGTGVIGAFATELIQQPASVNFGDIAVGANGEVIVTYGPSSGTSGTIYTNVDSDGLGPNLFSTFTPAASVNVGGFTYIPVQPNWGIDPEAGVVFDQTNGVHRGRVYLVYTDAPSVGSADTNIFVIYSDDQGVTWSAPVKVNDDATANSQFLPHISLDQSTGIVAVTWHDARNSAANNTAQYFGAFSSDGGTSFMPNFQISTGTSNQANSIAASRKVDFSDYTSNAFVNGHLVSAWGDNSNSTGDNSDTNFEVYTSTVIAPVVALPVACSAVNATITAVNAASLDVVLNAVSPATSVLYPLNPANTVFSGVTGFTIGALVDYSGVLGVNSICEAGSMTVKAAPASMGIAPSALPIATVGVSYSVAIGATGGLAPTTIVGIAGLPAGLVWNGAVISGTPIGIGASPLVVEVLDARGFNQINNLVLQVNDVPIVFSPSLASGMLGNAYTTTLVATGGYGAFTYWAAGLPAGLILNGAIIIGTPTAVGTFPVVLTATDSLGVTQSVAAVVVVQSASNYTIKDESKGKITSFGDHFVYVGMKKIIWDNQTTFILNTPKIAVGMVAQWKGKRDPVSSVVLASKLEVN